MSETVHTTLPAQTLRERLAGYIGRFLTAGMLLGLTHLETREGILSDVGPGWFVLRDPDSGAETLCDLHTLKFVSVCPCGMRPCGQPPAPVLPDHDDAVVITTPKDGGTMIETSAQGLFRRLGKDARLVLPCPKSME